MSGFSTTPARSALAFATADLLGWLILALRSVDVDSVARCLHHDPFELLARAGGGRIAAECLPSDTTDPSALVAELETEYVRLFLQNRFRAPANLEALAYMQNRGPTATSTLHERIRRHAHRLGVDVESGSPYPTDHLTILLELIYLEPPEGVAALARDPVWADCIAPWLSEFVERFRNLDPHPYYRCALRVLEAMHDVIETGPTGERI